MIRQTAASGRSSQRLAWRAATYSVPQTADGKAMLKDRWQSIPSFDWLRFQSMKVLGAKVMRPIGLSAATIRPANESFVV